MKKKIVIITLSLILGITCLINIKTSINKNNISSKLIRFHVIANSDLDYDQNLKLKVRDKVLEYISPKLSQSENINESRKIILENNNEIRNIASKVIKDNGYDYKVQAKLSHENFPIKTYGNITLPQGNYEAYRIIIGEGKGKNWWCVMFPPLCFVDITKGEVSYKKTESQMKKVLSTDEYNSVDNTHTDVKIKFKLAEIVKEIFQ